MELKHTNLNGEIVLENKLNHVQLLFLIVKIEGTWGDSRDFF